MKPLIELKEITEIEVTEPDSIYIEWDININPYIYTKKAAMQLVDDYSTNIFKENKNKRDEWVERWKKTKEDRNLSNEETYEECPEPLYKWIPKNFYGSHARGCIIIIVSINENITKVKNWVIKAVDELNAIAAKNQSRIKHFIPNEKKKKKENFSETGNFVSWIKEMVINRSAKSKSSNDGKHSKMY